MFLLAIIFLASIGKSLGVRRLYIKLLLALFEVSHRKHADRRGYSSNRGIPAKFENACQTVRVPLDDSEPCQS